MQKKRYLLLLLVILSLGSCHNAPDSAIDKFKAVDSTFTSQPDSADHSVKHLYATIAKKRKTDTALVAKADTMFAVGALAELFLDSLVQKLNKLDPAGDKLDAAGSILIGKPAGKKLAAVLLNVQHTAVRMLADTSPQAGIDEIFNLDAFPKEGKQWLVGWFDRTPTMGAITILRKFQNDCRNATSICLENINGHASRR